MSLEDAEDEELDAEAEEVAVAVLSAPPDSTSVCVSTVVSVTVLASLVDSGRDSSVELSWVTEETSLEMYVEVSTSVADGNEALSVALGKLLRDEIQSPC